MSTATAIRQRNVTPWADLSTMEPWHLIGLLADAVRRTEQHRSDAGMWRYYKDDARAERDSAQAGFWDRTYMAAMFTAEERMG